MRSDIVALLLKIGFSTGVIGFAYIHDALDLLDTDPYYATGKNCRLYAQIAKKHNATEGGVERGIRHAFDMAADRGVPEMVERYLDLENTRNAHRLRVLYLRWKQEVPWSSGDLCRQSI